jgi:8-oxo-dGTP pyrophosphatase MutT (NUDIX family)
VTDVDRLRSAAVLVPIFRDDTGKLRVVLIVRADDGGLHGGQIGLPGGRPEAGDADLRETALREAEEEIGLARESVDVLAELDPVETQATGFRAHPFLGRIRGHQAWVLQETEVVGVLTPTVEALIDPAARATLPFTSLRHSEPLEVDGIDIEGHVLWGMTLRILDDLLPRLVRGEWEI